MKKTVCKKLRIPTAAALVLSAMLLLCLCVSCTYERNLEKSGPPGDIDAETTQVSVSPSSMSRFAYGRIEISGLPFTPGQTTAVKVGALPCVDVAVESEDSVSCTVLPNCSAGRQTVTVSAGADEITLDDVFEFEMAGEPLLGDIMALGGGWMAGARNGALYPEAQLTSIAAYVARQANSCMPLPLAVAKGFPAIFTLDDLDRYKPILGDEAVQQALEPFMEDADNIAARRVIGGETALIAVPYISAGDEIDGIGLGSRADVFQRFVRPDGTNESIIEEIRRRQPGFVIADFEFFAYSRHGGHYTGTRSGSAAIEQDVRAFFDELATLENPPYLFVLNAPPMNIFPTLDYSEKARYESIWINNALHRAVIRANQAIQKRGLDARFFEVDLYGFMYGIARARGRVEVSGRELPTLIESNEESDLIITDADGQHQQLGFDLLEGFFSLDGYHPTATGSAMAANLILERINAELGPDSARRLLNSNLEPVDIASVLADDPLSSLNIQLLGDKLGFFPLEVYQDLHGLPELHTAHYCAIQWGGNQPDYGRCPARISVLLESNPQPVEPDKSINVRVFLKTGDKNKADWPVMAYNSGNGSFYTDAAWTSIQGYADFVYTSASDAGLDKLVFYCGDVYSEHEITVTPVKEGL